MEGIGSEVSQKIKAAIKAKLVELGAYVDDELPDYIMVMVANKRTKSQMDEDLQLFLSSNTKIFTSWLHTVLQKLQEVTIANFEGKKNSDKKKSKQKKDLDEKSRKSSEEATEKVRKHSKKYKEGKKAKKSKHKSKEKSKSRSKRKQEKEERKEKGREESKEIKTSQGKIKISKNEKNDLTDAVGKAILVDLKKNKKLGSDKDDLSQQESSSDSSSVSEEKEKKQNENESCKQSKSTNYGVIKVDDKPAVTVTNVENYKKEEMNDFNIESLKESEKFDEVDSSINSKAVDIVKFKEHSTSKIHVETTISAPTEKLLKEHDKLHNEKLEEERNIRERTKTLSDSDDSLSPEEIRKQLLLSRDKKKIEESKMSEKIKSHSPDVLVLEDNSEPKTKVSCSASRSGPSKPVNNSPESIPQSKDSLHLPLQRSRKSSLSSSLDRKSQSLGYSPSRLEVSDYKSKQTSSRNSYSGERRKAASPSIGPYSQQERELDGKICSDGEKRKRTVIKISESLELEKKMGVEDKKLKEKETTLKKRPILSRVVTISGPETPEIPSVVKVKPREFISKDKQANKALILKAVADAEKSIAAVQVRTEPEIDSKKKEALFTKNHRAKKYEKLAVTLSNVRKSPSRVDIKVSIDSEKSERSQAKHSGSDLSDGVRFKSDVPSRKLSKSDDQFISSKTSVMEKNDKYIRCWLEEVEKAVKQDEMINPNDIGDIIHSTLTDEENEFIDSELSQKDKERKRKRPVEDTVDDVFSKNQKVSEKKIEKQVPLSAITEESPQIVVTLDGLNSKVVKNLIVKNRESFLSSVKEKSPPRKKPNFLKISDRFGRLNKFSEPETERSDKKDGKHQNTEKDKQKKVTTESKNRQLIAHLSEKFGKVDREFENKKRKRSEEDSRYGSRRTRKEDEKNGKYRKTEKRSFRDGGFGFWKRS